MWIVLLIATACILTGLACYLLTQLARWGMNFYTERKKNTE